MIASSASPGGETLDSPWYQRRPVLLAILCAAGVVGVISSVSHKTSSWTVYVDVAQSIAGDDGPDEYWGATEMACLSQAYESTEPVHFTCEEFMGAVPDNTTCADPDQYMVDHCRNDAWCSSLCPDDLARHTVALCVFNALSHMDETCAWVEEQENLQRQRRNLLRSPHQQALEGHDEANEVMCDRVAYCNICGDECRRLINPTIRMHHLASATHGKEDDDGKAAWVGIPLVHHLPRLCECLRR